jgi:hypothetical protein
MMPTPLFVADSSSNKKVIPNSIWRQSSWCQLDSNANSSSEDIISISKHTSSIMASKTNFHINKVSWNTSSIHMSISCSMWFVSTWYWSNITLYFVPNISTSYKYTSTSLSIACWSIGLWSLRTFNPTNVGFPFYYRNPIDPLRSKGENPYHQWSCCKKNNSKPSHQGQRRCLNLFSKMNSLKVFFKI